MFDLDAELVEVLALAATGLCVVLLLIVGLLALRLRKLRRDLRTAFHTASAEDVLGALGRHEQELIGVRRRLQDVQATGDELRELLRGTVSRVGVVRYDAFDDMGGALSFSAALLDERGDGMIVSAINGRSETRCYAKPVSGGESDHSLSREEAAAINAAIEGRAPATVPSSGRRRRRAS